MKKLFLILVVISFFSCKKFNQRDFEFSVTINKTQYQIGQNIEYQIQGGHEEAAIQPVLVKYNSTIEDDFVTAIENGNVDFEYINMYNNYWFSNEYCCNPNTEDGVDVSCVVCNCELNTTEIHEQIDDEFYWGPFKQFKILILDPFITSTGRQEELGDCNPPNKYNIISESEAFYISPACHNINCNSLSQLSNYEAYTSGGSSSWTSEWVVNNSGINNGLCFSTQGNYCVGGFIEFNIDLPSPSRMTYYSKRGNYESYMPGIKVDGTSLGQSSVNLNSGYSSDQNYFGHYMTNIIQPGNHIIRMEFSSNFTYSSFRVDEIIFHCE